MKGLCPRTDSEDIDEEYDDEAHSYPDGRIDSFVPVQVHICVLAIQRSKLDVPVTHDHRGSAEFRRENDCPVVA